MKRILWTIVIVAALTSLGVFVQRWTVEVPNRTVEIVYDLPGLLESAEQMEGLSLDELLDNLKSAGVETIAIQPLSVGDLLLAGDSLPEQVWEHLPEGTASLGKILNLPVAFDSEHLELVTKAGLRPAPKLNTVPWAVEPVWLEYSPDLLIVSGQGIMELERFHGSNATIALVEFNVPTVLPSQPGNMVRLHGISAPEMKVLSDERILNRYVRAVQERNIRVLYVRPFVEGEDAWERSLALLDALQGRLEGAGFSLGQAQPFETWNTSWIWTSVVGAGIWAGALLLALDLFPLWKKPFLWLGLAAFALSIVLLVFKPILAKQGLALLAAVVFPSLAMQFKWGTKPLTRYAGAALVSILGALLVVATLSGTEFLVKIQEFRGVKLMHVVPIVLVVFTLTRPLKDWINTSIPIRHLLLLGALGLAGAFYILRTGNFGLPVLGLEVQVREFLENVLIVRPRTKELFLGHPALYFALHSSEPRKSWWLPVAVIGQISLVNTFTHTHTFLWVSLLRTGYGLFFGYLLGWLALRIFKWGKGKFYGDSHLRILRIRQSR